MRPFWMFFPALFLASVAVVAQPDAPGTPVTIYAGGADVTQPQLLPLVASPSYSSANCHYADDGTATFSLIVDSNGQPRNIYFLSPIGDDLDLIALKEVTTDRFSPGKRGDQPVAVAASLQVKLHACLAERKDARGKTQNVLELTSAPEQQLQPPVDPPQQTVLVAGSGLLANSSDPDGGIEKPGADVKPPVQFPPTKSTIENLTQALGRGAYKVSVVVDQFGLPQRLKVIDAELPDREQTLAGILRLYRWKPAFKNGAPVPYRIEVKIGAGSDAAGGRRR